MVYSRLSQGLLVAMLSFGVAGTAHAASVLTINQESVINQYGEWRLTTPKNTVINGKSDQTKTVSNLTDGQYLLTIQPPDGATATMHFYEGDTLLRTINGTEVGFKLTGDAVATINIVYSYQGKLIIESEPSNATFELTGPQGYRATGVTPAVFEDLPPYYFTVNWGSVEDCQRPRPQSRTMEAGSTVHFIGDYTCADEVVSITEQRSSSSAAASSRAAMEARKEQVNVRVWNSVHQAETVPGSSVLVTIGVRNLSKTTIRNLTLTESFDPNTLSVAANLPQGASLNGNLITWQIPQIYAGQSWTATFPVTVKESLEQGDQVKLTARVSGADIRAPRGELLSQTTSVGIAALPATGFRFDLLFLAISAGTALTLTSSTRRKAHVAQTASKR